MTESCVKDYCQDGLQVNFATETQQYTSVPIYGHYELQPNDVNGRPYFKMGSYGFWYDGLGRWWISQDNAVGQNVGFAYNNKDVFCPHQLSELNWSLLDAASWHSAGNDLVITCKCFFIQQQNRV